LLASARIAWRPPLALGPKRTRIVHVAPIVSVLFEQVS
jgi:hypothetical protein